MNLGHLEVMVVKKLWLSLNAAAVHVAGILPGSCFSGLNLPLAVTFAPSQLTILNET